MYLLLKDEEEDEDKYFEKMTEKTQIRTSLMKL